MPTPATLTRAEWSRIPADRKTTGRPDGRLVAGQRYILVLDPDTGATVLAPVTVED